MLSNIFGANEVEEVSPSYLDRFAEVAETAKSKANEISGEITSAIAEAASPKETFDAFVTSARDTFGDVSGFAMNDSDAIERTMPEERSPFAALVESAKDAISVFAMPAEGTQSPKEIVTAYAEAAKEALMGRSDSTYYVEANVSAKSAEADAETMSSAKDTVSSLLASAKKMLKTPGAMEENVDFQDGVSADMDTTSDDKTGSASPFSTGAAAILVSAGALPSAYFMKSN